MAVTYTTAVKNARLDAVVTAIGASGKLEIGTAGMASVLATFSLVNPAGTTGSGILTFDFDPDISATAGNSGTAAAARIRTGADVDIITGLTVGTGGTDVILDSTSITSGQTVTITTAAITHA